MSLLLTVMLAVTDSIFSLFVGDFLTVYFLLWHSFELTRADISHFISLFDFFHLNFPFLYFMPTAITCLCMRAYVCVDNICSVLFLLIYLFIFMWRWVFVLPFPMQEKCHVNKS